MNLLKKIKKDSSILWHSLFYGLRAADNVMQSQTNGTDGVEINEQVKPGGVFADMLEQKVTKEVEEMRDKHYRVLKEADKYKVGTLEMTVDEESGEVTFKGGVKKKTKEDFMQKPPVYETDDTKVILIQDVKQIEKTTMFSPEIPTGLYDYDTNITIERDFTPRFEIEKFAKKIVIRKGEREDRSFIDIYLPTEASQFGKIDAIFVSNMYSIFKERNFRSDITDFDTLQFYTDHAWNSDDFCDYSYNDIKMVDINVFDGSFVATFDANVISEGKDLSEKFKTKELDEKYAEQAPKKNTTDLFAIKRKIEKKENNEIDLNNIENTTIKI